jgi:hypothetical protein
MLNPDLLPLRRDCELLSIDTTRGSIRIDRDGYTVSFDPPLFDLGAALPDPPGEVRCANAQQAEFELLSGCRRLQLAERVRLRSGRVFGWSGSDINRRVITAEELREYKADLAHAAEVRRLTKELAQVVEANATAAKAAAGKIELESRYDLKPAKVEAKEPEAIPEQGSAKPQRSPSRSGARA